jgi:cysteinyl-tRNA synthetase
MTIKINNTLTGNKEEFKPVKENEVGIYVCGPTVYDEPHIGHIRSAYIFEVIRRYFSYRGYKVRYVRNITDIDDKIISKAKQLKSKELKKTVKQIAIKFHNVYNLALLKMGISLPSIEPKATQHIKEMQELIKRLIDKGYAYVVNGDVYYSVRKFKDYGKLSKRSIDELKTGVRIKPDEAKKDALDFALWKKAKEDEPSWNSPWGEGRPGWHIECSVMSMTYLGENFDIHCGGRDLVFPHHENEIAQAEAATGRPFANYWLHNGLLTIDGEKMSKSLGNFITIDKIEEKYPLSALKLFFLTTCYSHPLDFSWQKLDEAYKLWEKIEVFFNRLGHIERTSVSISMKEENLKSNFDNYKKEISLTMNRFEKAMDDDFNFPSALKELLEFLNLGNTIIDEDNLLFPSKLILLSEIKEKIYKISDIFLLFTQYSKQETKLFSQLVDKVIEIRDILRREEKYELADFIRKTLDDIGVVLEDNEEATSWRLRRGV